MTRYVALLIGTSVALFATARGAPTGDFDKNGYVDRRDFAGLKSCWESPPPTLDCLSLADFDGSGAVDLADIAVLQRSIRHLPFPLRDAGGQVITVGSKTPYNGRETCGPCHDVARIENGLVHQQGRTNSAREIIMKDELFGDGRWWVRGSGMYGRWSGGGGGLNRQTAGKSNTSESYMDMTAFYWAANCGGCHVGGGGVEFDRDGARLWDVNTGQFGYETLGMSAEEVGLDGDYVVIDDSDGSARPAPWNRTGVAAPECLHCHRTERHWVNNQDMHREWRAAVLSATDRLVDSNGLPIPAYASAGTAGQGWFSRLDAQADPPVLDINYTAGIDDGTLLQGEGGELLVPQSTMTVPPNDQACWGCHLPGGFQNKRGTIWFDDRDIHFRKFTNRNDETELNDIPDGKATTCNYCHPGDLDHNFAKGNSPYAQFRNELDFANMRSCRDCHLWNSPVRHPDAPEVLGPSDAVLVHLASEGGHGPLEVLSCQACHIPYPLSRGIIVTDRSVTGDDIYYFTDEFLSADPLDPTDADKSKWYPALRPKVDSDGVVRYFPQKTEVAIYWADWNQNGTPADLSDDTIYPIILWRVRTITGGVPLSSVSDDNGDGKPEVNRPEEMLEYMHALKGVDRYGNPVANRPVLVKGERVWYEASDASVGVSSFHYLDSGAVIQPYEIFGLDHNVLAKTESWGYDLDSMNGCQQCHGANSPVLDRLILIDPFGTNGQPIYKKVREMTGLNPP